MLHRPDQNPIKAEVFNDLIGQLETITTLYETVGSTISEETYFRWNQVLCKIIILASFSKINQVEFWQQKITLLYVFEINYYSFDSIDLFGGHKLVKAIFLNNDQRSRTQALQGNPYELYILSRKIYGNWIKKSHLETFPQKERQCEYSLS